MGAGLAGRVDISPPALDCPWRELSVVMLRCATLTGERAELSSVFHHSRARADDVGWWPTVHTRVRALRLRLG